MYMYIYIYIYIALYIDSIFVHLSRFGRRGSNPFGLAAEDVCVCVCVYIHIYICIYIYMYMYIYRYIYICIYIYRPGGGVTPPVSDSDGGAVEVCECTNVG